MFCRIEVTGKPDIQANSLWQNLPEVSARMGMVNNTASPSTTKTFTIYIPSMKKALITGIAGQDGAYLTDFY